MRDFVSSWKKIGINRQIVIVAATVGVFLTVLTMGRLATTPSMSLLYGGLERSTAGEIVQSLEQEGVSYKIQGDTIFVDSTHRDRLRMTLASQGLPSNPSSGYELLDNLSGFGTTSQMFDAAYWRAKEGELSRTISSNVNIESARVHIANGTTNPFQRDAEPTASVSIVSKHDNLPGSSAVAIRHLVASAVGNLSIENVTVVDSAGRLLGTNDDFEANALAEKKAETYRKKVERLLEARVGRGNVLVEVSVDTVSETEAIRERTFDPESRVAISTDTQETSSNSTSTGRSQVTVASNLPDGDAGGTDESQSQNNETREVVNFEVSEVERQITKVPGEVKRLTVAVLVNDVQTNNGDNITSEPREEAELASLRELVESAVGYDEGRGDKITIKSMQLSETIPSAPLAAASGFDLSSVDIVSISQFVILAVVAIILGVFVIRPIMSNSGAGAQNNLLNSPEGEVDGLTQLGETGPSQPGSLSGLEDSGLEPLETSGEVLSDLPMLPTAFSGEASPSEDLKNMIEQKQPETIELLRGWLEEQEPAS